ncbi:MAG: hypothetical protein ACREJM_11485 [Candidatus Saccharimonadales bacterium]
MSVTSSIGANAKNGLGKVFRLSMGFNYKCLALFRPLGGGPASEPLTGIAVSILPSLLGLHIFPSLALSLGLFFLPLSFGPDTVHARLIRRSLGYGFEYSGRQLGEFFIRCGFGNFRTGFQQQTFGYADLGATQRTGIMDRPFHRFDPPGFCPVPGPSFENEHFHICSRVPGNLACGVCYEYNL